VAEARERVVVRLEVLQVVVQRGEQDDAVVALAEAEQRVAQGVGG